MVTKPCLFLLFALILTAGLCGCSTTKPVYAAIDGDTDQIKLPIKFSGYRDFFTFVGTNANGGTGILTSINDETLFKLAAESRVKVIQLEYEPMPYVYLVETHYFKGLVDQIRGAQGNGQYYVLRPLPSNKTDSGGFELVGILDGNTCAVQHPGETPRFVTYWHLSANEHLQTVYDWNGRFFEERK